MAAQSTLRYAEDPILMLYHRYLERIRKRFYHKTTRTTRIELVGMKLKDNAWDWYEQNIKGQL